MPRCAKLLPRSTKALHQLADAEDIADWGCRMGVSLVEGSDLGEPLNALPPALQEHISQRLSKTQSLAILHRNFYPLIFFICYLVKYGATSLAWGRRGQGRWRKGEGGRGGGLT